MGMCKGEVGKQCKGEVEEMADAQFKLRMDWPIFFGQMHSCSGQMHPCLRASFNSQLAFAWLPLIL